MGLRGQLLSAAGATLTGCIAPTPSSEPFDGRVVYLAFADGREGVTLGDDDDATRNVSRLCSVPSFARWNGADDCGDRETCAETIRARVAAQFARYHVRVTTARPPAGTSYTMVIVAPPEADCSFGRRGVAFADCGDENPRNVAFAFDCQTDVDECAALIAHEAAHTFGLVHVSDPSDLMTSAPAATQIFSDTPATTLENECNVTEQNAHATLLTALGPAH